MAKKKVDASAPVSTNSDDRNGALWTIPHEMAFINNLIDQNEGEITDEIQAEIDRVMGKLNPERVTGICKWLRNLEARVKRDKAEAEFFAKRAKADEKKIEQISKRMIDAGLATEQDHLAGTVLSIDIIRAGRPTFEWVGKGSMPREYIRVKTIEEEDKSKMQEDFKNGVLPKGFKPTYSYRINIV